MLTLTPLNLPSVAHAAGGGDGRGGRRLGRGAADGAAADGAAADAAAEAAGDGVADWALQAVSTRTKPIAGAIDLNRDTHFLLLTHALAVQHTERPAVG